MSGGAGGHDVVAGVEVHGGVGGTTAHLADLELATGRLRRAAEMLDDAQGQVTALHDVVGRTSLLTQGTAEVAHHALARLGAADGIGAVAADLLHLAAALEASATAYRSADASARWMALRAAGVAGRALGDLGPGGWVAGLLLAPPVAVRTAWEVLTGRRSLTEVGELGVAGASGLLVGSLPGGAPAGPVNPLAARSVSGALTLLDDGRTRLEVSAAPVPAGVRAEVPPEGVGDVLRDVDALYAAPSAAVAVRRLERADGTVSWTVAVPGTRSGDVLGGPDPADMGSNLDLVARRPEDASALVVAAMREAGIRPGEPVMLVGHSQGGLAAMAVAGDETLADEFDVAAVVTAGSPVAGQDLPDDVEALHAEHLEDYVAVTDGAVNPPSPNRTTVRVALDASPSEDDRTAAGSPVTAHAGAVYARTLDRVMAVEDPSVRAFAAVADGVLGGEVVRSETRVWSGRRVPAEPGRGGTW